MTAESSRAPVWRDILLVGLALFLLHLAFLERGPLTRTEPNRAVPAHEMVESGDWLVPRLYGQPYLRKPPAHYWTLAIAETTLGPSEFAWRMPSALCAALLGALIAALAMRWYGRAAGLPAALAFLATVAIWSQSRAAEIDALNTFAAAGGALLLLDLAYFGGSGRASRTIAAGLLIGLALLAKGPAGMPVIGGALLVPFLVRPEDDEGPRGRFVPAVWLALLLGAASFGIWGGLLALAEPLSGETLAGVRELDRRVSGVEPGTIPKALLAPLRALLYALPIPLLIPLARSAWRSGALDTRRATISRAIVVAFGIALVLGAFGLMRRPRYHYPALPLLAPLAGAMVVAWQSGLLSEAARRAIRRGLPILVALYGGLFVVLAWRSVGEADLRPWLAAAGLVAMGATAFALRALRGGRLPAALAGLAAVIAVASFAHGAFKVGERRGNSSLPAAHALESHLADDKRVLGAEVMRKEPAIFLYADLEPERFGKNTLARQPKDVWVVLDQREYDRYARRLGDRIGEPVAFGGEDLDAFLVRLRGSGKEALRGPFSKAPCLTTQDAPASSSEALLLRARDWIERGEDELLAAAIARGEVELLEGHRRMYLLRKRRENGTVLIGRKFGRPPVWTVEGGVVCPKRVTKREPESARP